MLDFKELPQDGTRFELLVRELLFTLGYHVSWSGVGPDGGRDLICEVENTSPFGRSITRWLLQCKHFAHSNRSVGVNDIDSVVDSCRQHNCTAYAIISSTKISSSLLDRLESINSPSLRTGYLDSIHIERLLSTPQNWAIAQRFMPSSSGQQPWHVSHTTEPNNYIVNYRGYHFNLSNRIGSSAQMHFSSIERRIEDIEKIKLPENHFIQIRSIWYNDKSGDYVYYIDYMHPNNEVSEYTSHDISKALGDGWALDDSQIYNFDVRIVPYFEVSDHYDPNHYDYYVPYLGSFLFGHKRVQSTEEWQAEWGREKKDVITKDGEVLSAGRTSAMERLTDLISAIPSIKILYYKNSSIDFLSHLASSDSIVDVVNTYRIDPDLMMSAIIVFESNDFELVKIVMGCFSQKVEMHASLSRGEVFLPGDNELCVYSGPGPYFLRLSLHPHCFDSPASIREALNSYFLEASVALEKIIERMRVK